MPTTMQTDERYIDCRKQGGDMKKRQIIQDKIDLLTASIGSDMFLELVRFIAHIMRIKYEIKIFISRRFLDLYMEYRDIIFYMYEEDAEECGTILTNQSIVLLSEDELKNKLLIVDDVVLHGRTLDNVYKYLRSKGCLPEQIKVKVFLNNTDAYKIKSDMFQCLEANNECREKTWLLASDHILKSFYLGAQPYISYLPYWKLQMKENAGQNICSLTEKCKCGNLASAVQRQCGMESYILYEDQIHTWKPLSFCAQKTMVRVYKYNYMSEVVVVPYVVLNHIEEEGLKDYCRKLVDKQVFYNKISRLITGNLSKEIMHFLYGSLTYVISYVVGMMFLSQYKVDDAHLNRQIEKYNFGGMIHVDRSKIDDIIRIFEGESEFFLDSQEDAVCAENKEAGTLFAHVCSQNKDMKMNHLAAYYLKMSGQRDEKLAADNAGRMQGIEFVQLQKNMPQVSSNETWSPTIILADTGRGTIACTTVVINGKVYACSHLYAGEMNSSGNEDDLIYYVYPLMCLEQYAEENHLGSIRKKKEQLAKKISQKISQSGGSLTYSFSDFEVKQLINQSICSNREEYYLRRFPAYENDAMLRNCMQIEMEFEKELVT